MHGLAAEEEGCCKAIPCHVTIPLCWQWGHSKAGDRGSQSSADTLSPLVPEQRFQQMTQPRPDVQVQKNGLQPKTSLNGRGSDAAV